MVDCECDIVQKNKRILYVEPNDIYGRVDGVPMTPDYSDYCISVNLIAEVVSRFKQSGDDLTKKYIISWTTRPGVDSDGNPATANNWISFLQGQDAKVYGGDGTLLTTYYTDINYDDVVKNNIVEGLGIESVQVSFESYYTPTIVIKFIDVRGSSLFGREEAVHEGGENLTSSSVFGVFFTVPYPKFKLQIKGFYGHAVTYQLTCSDFKASFNSQTGNFEAVATFIGYSYSLLTDIPLRYLVAAPYCKYVGQSYWEKRLHSSDWVLSDGNPPQKLFQIIQTIRSLINGDEVKNKLMSDEETERKNNIQNEKTMLSTLATTLKEYIVALQGLNGTSKSVWLKGDGDEEQLLLFSHDEEIVVGEKVKLTSTNFIEAFDTYNNSNNGREFSNNLLPNGSHSVRQADDRLKFHKLCEIEKDNNGTITKVSFVSTTQDVVGIKSIRLNNNNTICQTLAQYLYNDSHPDNGNISDYFGEYCYLINLNCFLDKINERIENLNKEDAEIDKKVNEKVQEAAKIELGFTPYIGDVFKIIMCHLETFIHMMWECYHNIESSDRSPGHLNISIDDTDFVNVGNTFKIGPWPGVFNNGKKTNEGGEIDNATEEIAWVGDFSHNFEEEKLIIELYKAVQRIGEEKQNPPKPMTLVSGLPIMPNDLNNMSSVFNADVQNNISALGGYLSFRAAQIFGVLLNENPSPELAKSFGKMDAYNYFGYSQSRSDIKNTFLNAASGDSLENILYQVSKCDASADRFCETTFQETGKSRHVFETVYAIDPSYNQRQRHPMFLENGNSSKYIHYYTENKVGVVPDRMMSFNNYNNVFEYKGPIPNFYFDFKKKPDSTDLWEANGFLHKSSSRLLFDGKNGLNEYVNNDMFNVETNELFADSIKQKYDELKSGTFKIYGDEFTDDFNNVLEKLWHVTPSDYGEYFKGNSYMLSKKVKELGIEDGDLYPDKRDTEDESKAPKTLNNEKWLETGDTGITFDVTKDNWVDKDGNEISLGNLFVRFMQSNFPKSGGYDWQCLFGDPFYYIQNDNINKNDSNNDAKIFRQKCVKALLFLHTFKYNFKNVPEFLKQSKKSGGIYTIPYGYALFLGGLLWRQKYYMDKGVDPIQNSNGYREVGIENTLFAEINGLYRMCALLNSDSGSYNIKVASIFGGGNNWMPDHYVTNKLISLFKSFVNGEWGRIMTKLELQNCSLVDGERIIKDYTGSVFIGEVIQFKEDLTKALRNSTIYVTDIGRSVKSNVFMVIALKKSSKYFYNFFDNYKYIYVKEPYRNSGSRGLLLLLNENRTEVQDALKNLYVRKVIVTDSSGIRHSYNQDGNVKEININSESFKSYLQGFRTKLEDIVNSERASGGNEYGQLDTNVKRDLVLPMYLYLKVLWDKWLVSTTTKKYRNEKTVSYEDYYNVENFYNSFIFIDAFYKNIYKKFLINCETLKKSYLGRDEDGSLFQFIGDITSEHHCLFLALPDYVDMGNADEKKAVEEMMNMFRPIPYNEMNGVDDENRFVIIYTPRMSEIPSTMNNYREDYFRVWNPVTNTWDEKMPNTFIGGPVNDTNDRVSRYGYYVPSFGVAFSRQNNHLFKNIGLNMSTPLVTSASINALSNIAEKGSGASHKVAFMGQDLYPVFSNYSYICEIEMMGDAQIQPLMYFQLMNIPMWSGVYMIFNVTHTITAGNMTTKFKGMKLSRNPLPYNSSWYMFRPDNNDNGTGEQNEYDNYGGSNDGDVIINSSYSKAVDPQDHFSRKVNRRDFGERGIEETKTSVSKTLQNIYNCLYEEIAALPENKPNMKWNVHIISSKRAEGSSAGIGNASCHVTGNALDLCVTHFNENGSVSEYVQSGKSQPELYKVIDILCSLHRNEIYQILCEFYSTEAFMINKNNIAMIHFSDRHNIEGHKNHTKFLCQIHRNGILGRGENKTYTKINRNHDKEWFNTNVPKAFFEIAKKFYHALGPATFRREFGNYDDYTETELNELFGTVCGINSYDQSQVEFAKNMGTVSGGEGLEHQGKFTDPKVFARTIYNAFLHYGVSSTIAVCMTAQAALESDWGKSTWAAYSNYGGIDFGPYCDYQAPGRDRDNHKKAGYNNVGSYADWKIKMIDAVYGNATKAETVQRYFELIQGGGPKQRYYGGETPEERAAYGPKIMNEMIPSVKRRLT